MSSPDGLRHRHPPTSGSKDTYSLGNNVNKNGGDGGNGEQMGRMAAEEDARQYEQLYRHLTSTRRGEEANSPTAFSTDSLDDDEEDKEQEKREVWSATDDIEVLGGDDHVNAYYSPDRRPDIVPLPPPAMHEHSSAFPSPSNMPLYSASTSARKQTQRVGHSGGKCIPHTGAAGGGGGKDRVRAEKKEWGGMKDSAMNPYMDAWGDEYVSPSKLRSSMLDKTIDTDRKTAKVVEEQTTSALGTGGLFTKTITMLSRLLMAPIGGLSLGRVTFIHTAISSLYAVFQIMLFGLCCICNPFDSWGQRWGSVNIFTGAIRLPAMDLASLFPFWFRPLGIKKLEWGSVLALISFAGGIHVAMNVTQYNVGVIVEYVEKDKTIRNSPQLVVPATGKSPAKSSASRNMQDRMHYVLDKLKYFGINIALSFEEICVAVQQVKVSLDGTIAHTDEWWRQSTHFRVKDFNFTLSGSAQGGFLSYDLLEVRLLDDDEDLYTIDEDAWHEEDEEEEEQRHRRIGLDADDGASDFGEDIAARLTHEAEAADENSSLEQHLRRDRDQIDDVQNRINRRLFGDTASTSSEQGVGGDIALAGRSQRRSRNRFSLALEMPPLVSLSSFSCGASLFLQLTQLDFSNRNAMMDSYGEIKRIYKTSQHGNSHTGKAAGGTVGSSNSSPSRARQEHLRLRREMFSSNTAQSLGTQDDYGVASSLVRYALMGLSVAGGLIIATKARNAKSS